MILSDLTNTLRDVYAADTSADPAHWTPQNPTFGHCAVVAAIVQDHLGGTLLRTTVDEASHYFNRLPDGTEVDLTRDQFRVWSPTAVETRDREYVLSYPETARRYRLLNDRVRSRGTQN